ncbi:MAG: hypothetical protein CMF31_00670 [Kordiimonas sp.]|nr:hypothetical protein [Kordiimonas sp.]|tara:strand:- start:7588 stop:8175 length:588 start_codon:yes stop_codon:yes gene_type:complete
MQQFLSNLDNYPDIKDVYDYWLSLRPEGKMIPARKALQPQALLPLLPNCFLLEHPAKGEVYIRLFGTALVERAGLELTGINLLKHWPIADQKLIEQFWTAALRQPCITQYVISTANESGLSKQCLRTLFPLLDSTEEPRILFGYDHFLGLGDIYDNAKEGKLMATYQQIHFHDIGAGLPEENFAALLNRQIPFSL